MLPRQYNHRHKRPAVPSERDSGPFICRGVLELVEKFFLEKVGGSAPVAVVIIGTKRGIHIRKWTEAAA